MTSTQRKYINRNGKHLANYINYLVDLQKEYNLIIKELSKNVDNVTLSEDANEYGRSINKSYNRAKELYSDVKRIADLYRNGLNVSSSELQRLNMRLSTSELPIYNPIKMQLVELNSISVPTGAAADITQDEQVEPVQLSEIETTEEESAIAQEDDTKTTILETGIGYCHYVDDEDGSKQPAEICNRLKTEDADFYYEDEADSEPEGYSGDSFAAAAEYKRKYDEEQKHKTSQQLQQQKQNSAGKNWIMPCNGKIVGAYGEPRPTHIHNGIDIAVPVGTPIKAIADGKVVEARNADGYGKFVVIEHTINGQTMTSEYGHILNWVVSKGQFVKQGQIIAYSGNEGASDGPHCHLTIRVGSYRGRAVNPWDYIKY